MELIDIIYLIIVVLISIIGIYVAFYKMKCKSAHRFYGRHNYWGIDCTVFTLLFSPSFTIKIIFLMVKILSLMKKEKRLNMSEMEIGQINDVLKKSNY